MQKTENKTAAVMKKLTEIIKKEGRKPEDDFEVFDYDEEVESNLDAIEILTSVNLFKPPKDGKCRFIDGNDAFIVELEEQCCVFYVTQFPNKERVWLTIRHFFTAYAGNNYGFGVSLLLKTYGFRSKEEAVIEDFREKYQRNLEILKNGLPLMQDRTVHKIITPLLPVLEMLNFLGSVNVLRESQIIDGKHVFFSSSRYISETMRLYKPEEAKSLNITANIISMLALLGFIEKVKEENLPEDVKPREKKERNISFYIVRELNADTIENASQKALQIEGKAKELKGELLTASNITRNRVRDFFGEEEADRAFPNDSKKRDNATNKRLEWNNIYRIAKEMELEIDFKN